MRLRTGSVTLFAVLFSVASPAAEKELILWQEARENMSPGEVLDAVPRAKAAKDQLSPVEIEEVDFLEDVFSVQFFFEEDRLQKVRLTLQPRPRPQMLAAFDRLAGKIRARYGAEKASKVRGHYGTGRGLWSRAMHFAKGDLAVTFLHFGFGIYDPGFLYIFYYRKPPDGFMKL